MSNNTTISLVTIAAGLSLINEVITLGAEIEESDLSVESKYNFAVSRLTNNLIKAGVANDNQ